MPAHLKRFYGHHDLHFITFSCYGRKPLLAKAERRDLLLQVLEQMRLRYRFVVVGYVIMPEHVHLLISEPEKGNPSTVVQAIKLGFVRRALTPGQGALTARYPISRAGCPIACPERSRRVSRSLRDVGRPSYLATPLL